MAGIGFELKKLYSEDRGITRTIGAMGYSVVTTIGPILLIVGVLVITNIMMTRWGVGEEEKNVFSGSVMYCFVLAIIISSFFDTVISRYVSDCLFAEKVELIRPTIQGATVILSVIYGIVGIVFALLLFFVGGLDAYYSLMVYLLLMGVGLTFILSVFVTAIKAYRRITMAYMLSSAVIVGLAAICRFALGMPTGHSMITGFAIGFVLIATQLFVFLHMAFPKEGGNSLEFEGHKSYYSIFESMKKNKLLLCSGTFYILGLYVHNFVFWAGSDLQVVVARIIHCAPAYDVASFLAMLTSITLIVIFVVRVETSFYLQYKGYCEAVLGKNLGSIDLAREKMSRTLVNEVYFIGEFQLIITIVLLCLCVTFVPLTGIAGITLDIYPTLALGYYAVFMMHILMIFLYYFNDQIGAAFVAILFFVLTFVGTLITSRLGMAYYGVGLVFSACTGWVVAFMRLRSMVGMVDYIMFCDNTEVRMDYEI